MINLLSKLFIKNRDNYSDPAVRDAYGTLCGAIGVFLNTLLAAAKLFAGAWSGSIAVTADALNNLSDAGSSVVTLVSFKIASKKPDGGHPFGHGRMEYICGLVVSMIILFMGFELARSSIEKIVSPAEVEFNFAAVAILVVSILVKLYMAVYNRNIGKRINSTAMAATSIDSLSDCIATFAALLSMIVSRLFSVNIDGYAGLVVSGFIFYAGIRSAIETAAPLLGQAPDGAFVTSVHDIVMSYDGVVGIHDLIVHDYGPGRRMVSLHAEVPQDADIMASHDLIDNIERRLVQELRCHAVIHMDPVAVDDDNVKALKARVAQAVTQYDPAMSIHDFRVVAGPTHTNLIFDVVVPHGCKSADAQVESDIARIVRALDGHEYYAVIQIDRPFI
ncbi:MAG: cation diffusion facilitator family transporter [Clostridia bacterium]|nr:cation diffusion facilitator family transporter [Clostridia bacterium]